MEEAKRERDGLAERDREGQRERRETKRTGNDGGNLLRVSCVTFGGW